MKKIYIMPEMEIVVLKDHDVITNSAEGGNNFETPETKLPMDWGN